jgi:membrane-associated protease RseP (regulator of RpoE activity)
MKLFWSGAVVAALCLAVPLRADEPAKADAKPVEVPYRTTIPKHIMVRAKINGKGPFNFILDTGAPALFVSTAVCKKIGVDPDKNGWGTFDKFEIEGGVVIPKAKGRIEDPFQLEGMNGMGLAGAELHGVIGYNILARYKMEIDFTKDKMVWTPLDFEPEAPKGMGGKGGAGGLEFMGSLMKMFGAFLGKKATPDVAPRGFLGVELEQKGDDVVIVKSVLEKSPAAKAGVKAGDRITKVKGRTIENIEDVQRFVKKLKADEPVSLTVERDKEKKEISFTTGEGL